MEMIYLTRLNNSQLVVNADLIKFIEKAPDTVITLISGEKIVVRESPVEVIERVREFHLHSAHRIVFGALNARGAPENFAAEAYPLRCSSPQEGEKG